MKKIIPVIVVCFIVISGFGVLGTNLKTRNTTILDSVHDNNLFYTIHFPSVDELRFFNKNV